MNIELTTSDVGAVIGPRNRIGSVNRPRGAGGRTPGGGGGKNHTSFTIQRKIQKYYGIGDLKSLLNFTFRDFAIRADK